jgi:murein DD-endopeptidase MepM/ murein hydrolase activator NlpD
MYAVGRLRLAIVYALGMFVLLYGCSSSDETGETGGGATAASTTATLAFLQRPFRGSSLNSAPFDHDLPLAFKGDDNGYMLTWWGGRINGIWSGHHGHDWLLPAGTPVLAAADGEVVYADFEPPFQCGSRGEVRALVVRLRHVAPNGETFDSQYVHLSRIDVAQGQTVEAGQQIGLSGQTGCAGGPHLHFDILRLAHTNNGQPVHIDPFGWEGPGADPWAQHPDGAPSVWLWKKGQEPEGGKLIDLIWGPGTLEP